MRVACYRLTASGKRQAASGNRLTAYGSRLTAHGSRLTAYGAQSAHRFSPVTRRHFGER
ncbi:hypothetical protein BC2230_40484 [Burkholderia cepacia]